MESLKLNSSVKQKVKLGLILVAVLASLVLVFFAGRGYQKRIPSESELYLQEQVVLYQQELASWKERFSAISAEKIELEQNIQKLENQVSSIRDYYDKKVVAIKSYTNPELEQFFANRYPN